MNVDYGALNKMVRRHKSALTRAKKKGPEVVILAVAAAFRDFRAPGAMTPDDWPRWTSAFDDAVGEIRCRRDDKPLAPLVREAHDYVEGVRP